MSENVAFPGPCVKLVFPFLVPPCLPPSVPVFLPGGLSVGSRKRWNCIDPQDVASDLNAVPLVQSRISQSDYFFSFYPKDLHIKPFLKNFRRTPDAIRGAIVGFSRASQRRLGFTARNAGDSLTSMYTLTYHDTCPNGRESKAQLNTFLTDLRFLYPGLLYLWVLEFQERGHIHYHLFSNLPVTPYFRRKMALLWNRITGETPEHLKVHKHPKAFCDWKMGNGQYVTKYLSKMEQKEVPSYVMEVGRFWGSSRNLLPKPYQFTMDELLAYFPGSADPARIAVQLRRTILKCWENTLENMKNKSRAKFDLKPIKVRSIRARGQGCLVPFGLTLFYQFLEWQWKMAAEPKFNLF